MPHELKMDPMNFALRLRLRKLDDTGLYALILLHEILVKQGQKDLELVQGYLTVMGETCWHCWLRDGKNNIIDLGRIIATLKDAEFERCEFKYSTEKIDGAKVDQPNVLIWEKRNDANFWKGAPKKFIEFRSNCHSRVQRV